MKETDIAWLAGYLEGEGCFSSHDTAFCEVQVSSTDRDVIERVAGLIGAPMYPRKDRPQWKQQWITRLSGRKAIPIMRIILPYMGERRRLKIKELIDGYGVKLQIDQNALIEEIVGHESN